MSVLLHRRKAGPLSNLSAGPLSNIANNPAPSAIGAVIGTQIFNSAATATNVLTETINTGAITAGIVTGIQFASDSYSWITGKLPVKEVGLRILRNSTVNGTAVVGGAGGSAVGGAVGTAIFPGTGTVIGSVLGGVCGSISFGTLVADKMEDYWRGYKVTTVTVRDQRQILNLSLDYFGYSHGDFGDDDVVNMDSLTVRYRERCKVYHPDKGGSKEEWITLVNHFAIVTDALRKRDRGKNRAARRHSQHGLLNEAHHQEMAQLKQDKKAMKKEIESLKSQLKEAGATNIGAGHCAQMSTEDFFDVDLNHHTIYQKRNSIY